MGMLQMDNNRSDSNRIRLTICMHHIICDGWSMGILVPDLFDLYEAIQSNQDPKSKVPKLRYVDYASWQRDRLTGPMSTISKLFGSITWLMHQYFPCPPTIRVLSCKALMARFSDFHCLRRSPQNCMRLLRIGMLPCSNWC